MGERVSATFQVGGKMTVEQAQELINLAKGYDLSCTLDGSEPAMDNVGEEWLGTEINYGDLSELESYAASHGIDYEYWYDAGSEWSAHKTKSIGGVAVEFPLLDHEPAITLRELTELDALASGWAALHERIRLWRRDLPPVSIT